MILNENRHLFARAVQHSHIDDIVRHIEGGLDPDTSINDDGYPPRTALAYLLSQSRHVTPQSTACDCAIIDYLIYRRASLTFANQLYDVERTALTAYNAEVGATAMVHILLDRLGRGETAEPPLDDLLGNLGWHRPDPKRQGLDWERVWRIEPVNGVRAALRRKLAAPQSEAEHHLAQILPANSSWRDPQDLDHNDYARPTPSAARQRAAQQVQLQHQFELTETIWRGEAGAYGYARDETGHMVPLEYVWAQQAIQQRAALSDTSGRPTTTKLRLVTARP